MKQIVWVKSPRAGLGNKILVWANAFAYAKLKNVKLVTTGWLSLFIGPILRGERSLRFYSGYFNNDSVFLRLKIRILSLVREKYFNPTDYSKEIKNEIVVFDEVKFWMHFFDNIRDYRSDIREHFFSRLLRKELLKRYESFEETKIAVHIRMGDFSEMKDKEKFNWDKSVLERTPLDYFREVISEVRRNVGENEEVLVFSDGTEEELKPILELSNVRRSNNKKDIEDLLQLSKSKIIIASASSTFSLLAGYLSDAVLIHHPDFYMRPVRDAEFNKKHYEGPYQVDGQKNMKLVEALRSI